MDTPPKGWSSPKSSLNLWSIWARRSPVTRLISSIISTCKFFSLLARASIWNSDHPPTHEKLQKRMDSLPTDKLCSLSDWRRHNTCLLHPIKLPDEFSKLTEDSRLPGSSLAPDIFEELLLLEYSRSSRLPSSSSTAGDSPD
ncbi:unnamed protein product [Caenorhabditis nigoni]